jgi:alkylhydroperoxidase family enzyme
MSADGPQPRIAPLPAHEFATAPGGGRAYAEIASQAFGGLFDEKPPLNVLTTIANHPSLLPAALPLFLHVAGEVLPARHREMVILRVAWCSKAPYMWAHHHRGGLAAGLTAQEIDRIADGGDPPGWVPFEAALLRAVDELHDDSRISDETWQWLTLLYNQVQLLELLALVGTYKLIAFVLNSCRVPTDPWLDDPAPMPASMAPAYIYADLMRTPCPTR